MLPFVQHDMDFLRFKEYKDTSFAQCLLILNFELIAKVVVVTERQGAFTISTRLLLSGGQRAQLAQLVRNQRIDLADMVSMIVADHCDALPSTIVARPAGAMTIPIRLFLTLSLIHI